MCGIGMACWFTQPPCNRVTAHTFRRLATPSRQTPYEPFPRNRTSSNDTWMLIISTGSKYNQALIISHPPKDLPSPPGGQRLVSILFFFSFFFRRVPEFKRHAVAHHSMWIAFQCLFHSVASFGLRLCLPVKVLALNARRTPCVYWLRDKGCVRVLCNWGQIAPSWSSSQSVRVCVWPLSASTPIARHQNVALVPNQIKHHSLANITRVARFPPSPSLNL